MGVVFKNRGKLKKTVKILASFPGRAVHFGILEIVALRRDEKKEETGKNRMTLAAPVLAQFRFEN